MNKFTKTIIGIIATLVATALYHGPFGAAARFEAGVERAARAELDHQEMTAIHARLDDSPLERTLLLSGPADDFQRRELARIMDQLPGVRRVRWDPASLPAERVAR